MLLFPIRIKIAHRSYLWNNHDKTTGKGQTQANCTEGFIRKNTLESSGETHIHYCCHENNFAYVNVQRNETESPICMP